MASHLRRLRVLVVALHLGLPPVAFGVEPDDSRVDPGARATPPKPDADPPPRWTLPRKRQDDDLDRVGQPPDGPDWNPLSGPARRLKRTLLQHGIDFDLDAALYDADASDTISGHENLATFAWQFVGDWELLHDARLGTGYLGWTLLGSPGLGYDTDDETLSGNVGSISGLNANVSPDPAALAELFWKQISPDQTWTLLVGRVDPSSYFDTNRAANDAYHQFFAAALENNPSIPFAAYGGLGLLLRRAMGPDGYLMAAAGNLDSDEPWASWKSLDDNAWAQHLEAGYARHIPGLGLGQYRLIPWHHHVSGEDGFGIAFNLDQELGLERLVGFLRAGIGDDDVTPVERFLSGGVSLEEPFGRDGDEVALGIAWSDPSPGDGRRGETLIEAYYRLSLSPSLALTPDVQIVIHPAARDDSDTVVVLGVRLELQL